MELTEEQRNRISQIVDSKPVTIGRDEPQRDTLKLLGETFGLESLNLVETGTSRNSRESADGWGTVFLCHWANATNSKVWTVDISAEHIENCKKVCGDNSHLTYAVDDSVHFLRAFKDPIHLLYLDSYDFDQTEECYQHQLSEIKAVHDKLVPGSIVVSDDNYKEDWTHGKGNYSIPWMLENGYKLVEWKDSQAILVKG